MIRRLFLLGVAFSFSVFSQGFAQSAPVVSSSLGLVPASVMAAKEFAGILGLGTLQAAGAFKDFKTEVGYGNVYKPIFEWDLSEWKWSPDFTLSNGEMRQSDTIQEHIARLVTPYYGDFSAEVMMRKTSVQGALQFIFGSKDDKNYYRVVLGGPGMKVGRMEKIENGIARPVSEFPFVLDRNRWYHVQIVVKGEGFRLFLDGKVVAPAEHELPSFRRWTDRNHVPIL